MNELCKSVIIDEVLTVSVTSVLFNNIVANDDGSIGMECAAPDCSKVVDCIASEFSGALNDLLLNVSRPYEGMSCYTVHADKCTSYNHH